MIDKITLIQGLIIGLSLIIAIGPQNLFVIKKGIENKHIFIVCLICSISDALLIILGITGITYFINISKNILIILKITVGIWLIFYGLLKYIKAYRNKYIFEVNKTHDHLKPTIIMTLILTFGNPHVYLDTIVLIGAMALNFENKFSFGLGLIIASFLFFYFLGYFSKFI